LWAGAVFHVEGPTLRDGNSFGRRNRRPFCKAALDCLLTVELTKVLEGFVTVTSSKRMLSEVIAAAAGVAVVDSVTLKKAPAEMLALNR